MNSSLICLIIAMIVVCCLLFMTILYLDAKDEAMEKDRYIRRRLRNGK